jgi:squalene-hopene cyclase-like protein
VEFRRSVERALAFLESGGVAWVKERGCTSCHQVPFLLWSHHEAKRRGFPVDVHKLETWTIWTLVDMLARGDGGGLETLTQVLLGRERSSPWRQKPPRHLKTVDPYETLWGFLLDKQKPDGSFPSEGQRGFPEDISTSWALLALASRDTAKAPKDASEGRKNGFGPGMTRQLQGLDGKIPKSRERTLTWLKSAKPDDSTVAVLLRLLVTTEFGDRVGAEAIRAELSARQKPDGGWAYQHGGKQSDAFATGLALYALSSAAVKAHEPVITRAQRFLQNSQQPNGSWVVSSHSIHNDKLSEEYLRKTDEVYSYWGTAWAIGLLHTLPAEARSDGDI